MFYTQIIIPRWEETGGIFATHIHKLSNTPLPPTHTEYFGSLIFTSAASLAQIVLNTVQLINKKSKVINMRESITTKLDVENLGKKK